MHLTVVPTIESHTNEDKQVVVEPRVTMACFHLPTTGDKAISFAFRCYSSLPNRERSRMGVDTIAEIEGSEFSRIGEDAETIMRTIADHLGFNVTKKEEVYGKPECTAHDEHCQCLAEWPQPYPPEENTDEED